MDAIARTFQELERHLKRASIAQIGGFRPPDDPSTSWFGGKAVCGPGEATPTYRDKPMFPLLQINCRELPHRPPQLEKTELLVLYMNSDEIPFGMPNGEGWLIREYQSLDGLVPFAAAIPAGLKPFPIRWLLSEPERPGWEDAWSVVDLKPINESDEASDSFFEFYPNHHGTKVGGYPSQIQHGIGLEPPFVFQVGSEEKPNHGCGPTTALATSASRPKENGSSSASSIDRRNL